MNGMKIKTYMKRMALSVLLAVLPLVAFVSCDDFVYDYEGDCSVTYRLKFRYEKNLKWADAFANEVKSVNLYAFDTAGVLVWQKVDKGSAIQSKDYSMTLDLPAGDYQLVAWCGVGNEEGNKSFSVPEMTIGSSRIEDLQCWLKRSNTYKEGGAHSTEMLDFLFHGMMNVSLPKNEDGAKYDYTMYLTKDVNHVRIILQHLSAQDVDVNDFVFRIEDDNGRMGYDNELIKDEKITYHAWNTQSGTAGIVANGEVVNCATAIADLTVARMTVEHSRNMLLTITTKDGETVVAGVPVIDYALLAKDYYEMAYGHSMTPQDFLDREDEYEMTFFLDENNKWISSYILIHSWRVVPSDVNLDK